MAPIEEVAKDEDEDEEEDIDNSDGRKPSTEQRHPQASHRMSSATQRKRKAKKGCSQKLTS